MEKYHIGTCAIDTLESVCHGSSDGLHDVLKYMLNISYFYLKISTWINYFGFNMPTILTPKNKLYECICLNPLILLLSISMIMITLSSSVHIESLRLSNILFFLKNIGRGAEKRGLFRSSTTDTTVTTTTTTPPPLLLYFFI